MNKKQWLGIIIAIAMIGVYIYAGFYMWGNKDAQPTITDSVNQKGPTTSLCKKLGSAWELFSDKTSISFCYNNLWGEAELKETEISPEAKIGTIYYISFSKSVGNFPLISYSTLDFKKIGDSDVPEVIDWSAINTNESEAQLTRLFPDESTVVKRIVVRGKLGLKVNRDFISPLSQERIKSVDYFVPNIIIGETKYNLHIMGSPQQEDDLDKLISSLFF